MKPRILMTGATGFLGKAVLPLLKNDFDVEYLSRSGAGGHKADITQWNCGIKSPQQSFTQKFDLFLHLAGHYDLLATEQDCFMNNVLGTTEVLRLCQVLNIPRVINISSVAAAINSKQPTVSPLDLDLDSPFPDAYSKSKALAEKIFFSWNGLPQVRINLRLGVLVGDSKNGEIARLDGPYCAIAAFKDLKNSIIANLPIIPMPGNAKTQMPLVPVDQCAWAIAKFCHYTLSLNDKTSQSFHITPKIGVTVLDLYTALMKYVGLGHKKIELSTRWPAELTQLISKYLFHFPQEQLNYLMSFPKYSTAESSIILGSDWCSEFSQYQDQFWGGYEKFISNRRD
jgi:UDP-glucose 4-epimerase